MVVRKNGLQFWLGNGVRQSVHGRAQASGWAQEDREGGWRKRSRGERGKFLRGCEPVECHGKALVIVAAFTGEQGLGGWSEAVKRRASPKFLLIDTR